MEHTKKNINILLKKSFICEKKLGSVWLKNFVFYDQTSDQSFWK